LHYFFKIHLFDDSGVQLKQSLLFGDLFFLVYQYFVILIKNHDDVLGFAGFWVQLVGAMLKSIVQQMGRKRVGLMFQVNLRGFWVQFQHS